jgi:Tol biopolymer transport system component
LSGVLGAGGMGEVYRAHDTRLRRDVAIKILPSTFSSDSQRLRRFEQEAHAAASLNHPNILAVHDIGTDNGAPFIVSELLEGETLREKLRAGPLSVRKAIDYAIQIARGLGAAHDKGIVHRDLKPENVFVTRDGRVKILDFGLAKLTQPNQGGELDSATIAMDSEPGIMLGTVGYLSPEQVRGKAADSRSDVFSFGAVLYEMLSGKRAFKADSPAETLTAILKEEPAELSVVNPKISPALEHIVRHCLEKNPEERFQSAHDVAFDLETVSSVSSAASPALRVIGKRRLVPFLLVASVVVMAVLAFVLGRTTAPDPEPPRYRQVTFRRGYLQSAKFAPDGDTVLYTASWEGGEPELYSTRAGTSQGSLSMGLSQAEIVGISPAGEVAVITHERRLIGWVKVGTLARTQLTGGPPRAIAEDVGSATWSPDGRSLAVARYAGQRFRIEYPTGKKLYDTGGWISHMQFSPAGDAIAFIDHPLMGDDRGSVALVDLAGNKKTVSREFASIQGLFWSPSGKEIWFTGSESGTNTALFATTRSGVQRVVMRTPGRLILQDVARDGRLLLSRESVRRAMLFVDADSRERDLSLLDWSLSSYLSPDGQYVLFSEEGDGGGPNYSVYLRKTDGSPATRLGEGTAHSLSPDKKWAITSLPTSPAQLFLFPTGAGEPRQITNDQIDHEQSHGNVQWLPDGEHIVFVGVEPGGKPKLYLRNINTGKQHEIGPTSMFNFALSPDGGSVVLQDEQGRFWIHAVNGDERRQIAGLTDGDVVIGWSADGRSLFVTRTGGPPARVDRLDLRTGRRELFRQHMPTDPAGIVSFGPIQITPDGKSKVYGFTRILSELYVVDGLR